MGSWQDSVSEFFRKVGEYLRRGSEKAGEWIDEQAAITQRVRAIRRLRAEQRRVLEIIGSKVYTLHTRGKVRNKDVLQDCQRVDEIIGHIERLRREIEEIKSKSRYPQVKLMDVRDDEPLVEAGEEEAAERGGQDSFGDRREAAPDQPNRASETSQEHEQGADATTTETVLPPEDAAQAADE